VFCVVGGGGWVPWVVCQWGVDCVVCVG
jgi:hypothetical protein